MRSRLEPSQDFVRSGTDRPTDIAQPLANRLCHNNSLGHCTSNRPNKGFTLSKDWIREVAISEVHDMIDSLPTPDSRIDLSVETIVDIFDELMTSPFRHMRYQCSWTVPESDVSVGTNAWHVGEY